MSTDLETLIGSDIETARLNLLLLGIDPEADEPDPELIADAKANPREAARRLMGAVDAMREEGAFDGLSPEEVAQATMKLAASVGIKPLRGLD